MYTILKVRLQKLCALLSILGLGGDKAEISPQFSEDRGQIMFQKFYHFEFNLSPLHHQYCGTKNPKNCLISAKNFVFQQSSTIIFDFIKKIADIYRKKYQNLVKYTYLMFLI